MDLDVEATLLKVDDAELVVGAPRDDLLAGGPEQDGVLELSRVAALDVAQWRVWLHDALFAKILQRHLQKKKIRIV